MAKHGTKTKNGVCVTPGCIGEVGDRSITGLCSPCYSYIYSNQKRTPRQVLARAHKMQMYQSRLNFLLPAPVEMIRPKPGTPHPELVVIPGHVKKWRRKNKNKSVYKSLKAVT